MKKIVSQKESVNIQWRGNYENQLKKKITDLLQGKWNLKRNNKILNEIISNHDKGMKSLLDRNMELQYRLNYEMKLNSVLKKMIKNNNSGGDNQT